MPSKGRSEGDEPTFEKHLEALEKVVADLEGDALSLESSIDRYRQGVGHLAACRRILDAAEQRLAELVASADGSLAERPLAVGPEGLVDAGPASAARADRPAAPKARKVGPAPGAGDDPPF